MNNYRLRLVLASACLSAALTVLALKFGGFLTTGGGAGDLRLLATRQGAVASLSPYRVVCTDQIAMIVDPRQAGSPRRLADLNGHSLRCRETP